MTFTDFFQTAGTFLANFALLGGFLFVVSYGLFFRWYETAAGRSVMAFASSIVALSILSAIFRVVEDRDSGVYVAVRFVILLFVASACWGLLVTLWHTRYKRENFNAAPRHFTRTENLTVNMNDRIIAYIRTGTPAAVGAFLTWLISRIPAVADWLVILDGQLADLFGGLDVTVSGLLTAIVFGLVTTGYYAAARWLGAKFPAVEKWLLGRSAIPVYLTPQNAETVTETVPVPAERKASVTFGEDVVITEGPDQTK